MGLEWNCPSCTYLHKTHGTRCVMCGALRVTKQQMREFVAGDGIPAREKAKSNNGLRTVGPIPGNNTGLRRPGTEYPHSSHLQKLVAVRPSTAPQKSQRSGGTSGASNPYARNGKAAASNPHTASHKDAPGYQNTFVAKRSGSLSNPYRSCGTQSQNITSNSYRSVNPGVNNDSSNCNQIQHKSDETTLAGKDPNAKRNFNSGECNARRNGKEQPMNPYCGKNGSTDGPVTTPPLQNVRQDSLPSCQFIPSPCSPRSEHTSQNESQMHSKNQLKVNIIAQPQRCNRSSKGPLHPPAPAPPAAAASECGDNPFVLASREISPSRNYTPGPISLDYDSSGTWVYPLSDEYPIRKYQLSISHSAIMQNALVSLPTGLGKTLIAAVVMYNYYRWFGPSGGKVVFCAPTRPLVSQQLEACYRIMGIPAHDTAEISGRVKPEERKELWEKRKMFFCTPQTLQKDIDEDRCVARSIVCIVLDEAHKARGDYAYTKVVDQIEASGAKFRVLGLSATPGTSIKVIQEVVAALRISKIEARAENDPNIQKYVHTRKVEIVKVKASSAVTTIERLFNECVHPLLECLRRNGGLATMRGGNSTLTSYCMMRAREDYIKRTGDQNLSGHFFALQSLIGIRNDMKISGIGVAKTKIMRIMSQNSKGIMGAVVKGKEFLAVWEAVLRATDSGKSSSHESTSDLKLNNPKLQKLDEVLIEHFQRTRAVGGSSRAIVFSQWRDSVEEIVTMLESSDSLIRPRKFVGQSTSSSSGGGGDKGDKNSPNDVTFSVAKKSGMKQSEQQEVIRQFRSGLFNVIVCTCIGEEGLDIGEVDLIVNFDCLKSPIRMIQRTGRTGRKRAGRVVCLVAEGQEEKRLESSETAIKFIGRVLRDSGSFQVKKNEAMFPNEPRLVQRNMVIETDYHMSQVGGHCKAKRSERRDGTSSKRTPGSSVMPHIDLDIWRLSAAQEKDKQARFGPTPLFSCGDSNLFPQGLRRRYLRARSRTIDGQTSFCTDRQRQGTKGRVSNILRHIEDRFLMNTKGYPVPKQFKRINAVKNSQIESLQEDLHPLEVELSYEHEVDDVVVMDVRPENETILKSRRVKKAGLINIKGTSSCNHVPGLLLGEVVATNAHNDDSLDALFGLPKKLSFDEVGESAAFIFDCKKHRRVVPFPPQLADETQSLYVFYSSDEDSNCNQNHSETGIEDESVNSCNNSIESWMIDPHSSVFCSQPDLGPSPPPIENGLAFNPTVISSRPGTPFPSAVSGGHPSVVESQHDSIICSKSVSTSPTPLKLSPASAVRDTDLTYADFSPVPATSHEVGDASDVANTLHVNKNVLSVPFSKEDANAGRAAAQKIVNEHTPSNVMASINFELSIDSSSSGSNGEESAEIYVPITERFASIGPEKPIQKTCEKPLEEIYINKDCLAEVEVGEADKKAWDKLPVPCTDDKTPKTNKSAGLHNANTLHQADVPIKSTGSSSRQNEDTSIIVGEIGSDKCRMKDICLELPTQSSVSSSDDDAESKNVSTGSVGNLKGGTSPNKKSNEISFKSRQSIGFSKRSMQNLSKVENDGENKTAAHTTKCKTSPIRTKNTLTDLSEDTPVLFRAMGNNGRSRHAFLTQGISPDRMSENCTSVTSHKEHVSQFVGKIELENSPEALIAHIDRDKKLQSPSKHSRVLFLENEESSTGSEILEVEILCSVCLCGVSPETDPIVLCDGPGNNGGCNIAVHKSCYGITAPLDKIEHWRCEPCQEVSGGRALLSQKGSIPTCFICNHTGGVLKKTPDDNWCWVHTICMFWTPAYAQTIIGEKKSPDDGFSGCIVKAELLKKSSDFPSKLKCHFCSTLGGVECSGAGCDLAAHPYCARSTLHDSKIWTLGYRKGKSLNPLRENSPFFGFSTLPLWNMFCPKHQEQAAHFSKKSLHDKQTSHSCQKCAHFQSNGLSLSPCLVDSKKCERNIELIDTPAKGSGLIDTPAKGSGRSLKKRTRLRKMGRNVNAKRGHVQCSQLEDQKKKPRLVGSEEERKHEISRRDKLRQRVSIFFDTEAGIDSDEDMVGDKGEDSEIKAIEDEEISHDSFINDTSQLGHTQDALDLVENGDANEPVSPLHHDLNCALLHRNIDNEKEHQEIFATPVLNRRIKHKMSQNTPPSASFSQKGLGKMHFIKSVIEHHKAGGDAKAIEDFYNNIEQESKDNDVIEGRIETETTQRNGPILIQFDEHNSNTIPSPEKITSEENSSSKKKSPHEKGDQVISNEVEGRKERLCRDQKGLFKINLKRPEMKGGKGLTDEQKTMIEAKRQEALKRKRLRSMQEQTTSSRVYQ